MNYLVHLSCSIYDEETLPGNFIFDLLNSKEKFSHASSLVKGIALHKQIDSFSNSHPALQVINSTLHPVVHKYAPVVSDIMCDQLMFKQWDALMPMTYKEFEQWVYKRLRLDLSNFPERLHSQINHMIERHWLRAYTETKGTRKVLERLNQKINFPIDLTAGIPVFTKNHEMYLDLFSEFYSDLMLTIQPLSFKMKGNG